MTQVDAIYYRGAAAGDWDEVVYTPGADFGAALTTALGNLAAEGGELWIGPSSGTYRITTTPVNISKPVRITCSPNAEFQWGTAGLGGNGGFIRFLAGSEGSVWEGGILHDASTYAMTVSRTYLSIATNYITVRDVTCRLANTVATNADCAFIRAVGSDPQVAIGGLVFDAIRFEYNGTQEASFYEADGFTPKGWVLLRLKNVSQSHVTNITGTTPTPAGSAIGIARGLLTLDNCLYMNVHGINAHALSINPTSLSHTTDEGGLIEVLNSGASEGHHVNVSDVFFEVIVAPSSILVRGGAYAHYDNISVGRAGHSRAALRFMRSVTNFPGVDTQVTNCHLHNISTNTAERDGGHAIWVQDQQAIFIDNIFSTLTNRQAPYNRYPVRVGSGCKQVDIGLVRANYNTTASNSFPPFEHIVFENNAAYQSANLLHPTFTNTKLYP